MKNYICTETGKTVTAKTYREAAIKMFGECDVYTEKGIIRRLYTEVHRGYCKVRLFGTDSDNKDKYGINNMPDYYTIKVNA